MKTVNKRRPLINQYGGVLLGLQKPPNSFKKRLFKYGDINFIKCVCECCKNVLNGNVNMSDTHKALLSQSSKNIRKLANKSISIKTKRNLITTDLLKLITETVKPVIEQL